MLVLMKLDRNKMEVLSRVQCLELLSRSDLGRIAITMGALPVILPISYALLGEDVVFKTGTGSKLRAAISNSVVAFEVDEVDLEHESAWSVLVTGMADEITNPREIEQASTLRLRPWITTEPSFHIRIRSDIITGRRFVGGLSNHSGPVTASVGR